MVWKRGAWQRSPFSIRQSVHELGDLPLRPCGQPGCRTLCESGYCPEHKRTVARQKDEQRGGSAARGYDADHRRLRVLCFIRDEWRCVDCGWEPNLVKDFRQFELGPPPVEQVLAELRERFSQGERHLHADHQIPITQCGRTFGSISTTFGPGAIRATRPRPCARQPARRGLVERSYRPRTSGNRARRGPTWGERRQLGGVGGGVGRSLSLRKAGPRPPRPRLFKSAN
jgi:hypothetical protein